mmetsp:Transcript_10336/g.32810  ORF Transcript_10336/g.32810 Transcript_10336/m.32810 type:complete len:683 (+) Transcript_10336:1155-3203(+)
MRVQHLLQSPIRHRLRLGRAGQLDLHQKRRHQPLVHARRAHEVAPCVRQRAVQHAQLHWGHVHVAPAPLRGHQRWRQTALHVVRPRLIRSLLGTQQRVALVNTRLSVQNPPQRLLHHGLHDPVPLVVRHTLQQQLTGLGQQQPQVRLALSRHRAQRGGHHRVPSISSHRAQRLDQRGSQLRRQLHNVPGKDLIRELQVGHRRELGTHTNCAQDEPPLHPIYQLSPQLFRRLRRDRARLGRHQRLQLFLRVAGLVEQDQDAVQHLQLHLEPAKVGRERQVMHRRRAAVLAVVRMRQRSIEDALQPTQLGNQRLTCIRCDVILHVPGNSASQLQHAGQAGIAAKVAQGDRLVRVRIWVPDVHWLAVALHLHLVQRQQLAPDSHAAWIRLAGGAKQPRESRQLCDRLQREPPHVVRVEAVQVRGQRRVLRPDLRHGHQLVRRHEHGAHHRAAAAEADQDAVHRLVGPHHVRELLVDGMRLASPPSLEHVLVLVHQQHHHDIVRLHPHLQLHQRPLIELVFAELQQVGRRGGQTQVLIFLRRPQDPLCGQQRRRTGPTLGALIGRKITSSAHPRPTSARYLRVVRDHHLRLATSRARPQTRRQRTQEPRLAQALRAVQQRAAEVAELLAVVQVEGQQAHVLDQAASLLIQHERGPAGQRVRLHRTEEQAGCAAALRLVAPRELVQR